MIAWLVGGLFLLAGMLWAYKGDPKSRVITVKTRHYYRKDE